MKKVEQKHYGLLSFDTREKDIIQIWMKNKFADDDVIHIERDNIKEVISILKQENKAEKLNIELPTNGSIVKFRFGPTRPWLYGTFIESEQMFFVDLRNFFYAFDVFDWKYYYQNDKQIAQ